jgi:hypothetical protein
LVGDEQVPRKVARNALRLAVTVGLSFLLGLHRAPPANAQHAAGLVVIPLPTAGSQFSYLKLEGRPGQVGQAGAIELVNSTRRSMRVALAPVDGLTLDTLGSSYDAPGSPIHGATRWLRLDAHTLLLRPHTKAIVPVAVAVPGSAAPGDRLSGISIEVLDQAAPKPAGAGVSTASSLRYVIGVETSLPGPRHPSIRFAGATLRRDPAGLTFLLKARNQGNSILQHVDGQVRISSDGRVILARSIAAGTFLSHTGIAYPVPALRAHPHVGTRYEVLASLRYDGKIARLKTSVNFGHHDATIQHRYERQATGGGRSPWPILALAGALLYGLLATLLLLRRARSRTTPSAPEGMQARH